MIKFEEIFRASQKELKHKLKKEIRKMGYQTQSGEGYLYGIGEIPILLVAHLDTVHKEKVKIICYSKDGKIMSPQGIGGDDRCGVYMILKVIEELKCHVLFCEDEEIGMVGAGKFCKSGIKPEVNFIIELDRMGANDAVFYDCDNPDFTDHITSFGFQEEWGSFSDISEIAPYLGVAAVNISSGYYNAHTKHEYVDMNDVKRNIEKVKNIIRSENGAFYEYIECRYYSKYYDIKDDFLKSSYYDEYLMELYDTDGFIVNTNGDVIEAGGYYVDMEGTIYTENKYGIYVMVDDVAAFTPEGELIKFDDSKADFCVVKCY